MKNSVLLPSALQLCVDDVGWFFGRDDRYMGRPSRTGMPRKHYPEDYEALADLGKAIDMKIMCPICLAEWDKDNILRGKPGFTYEPDTWDRASIIDYKVAEKSFEIAENSEYLEYAYHGNLHGNYAPDGSQITEMEFFEYKNPGDKLLSTQSEEEILYRLDVFNQIYNSWGFKKKIRSFCAPNGIPKHLTNEDLLPLASALKKNNVEYWTSRWKKTVCDTVFYDGIIYMEKNVNFGVPWDAYDFDPEYMKDFAKEGDEVIGDVLGMHWPNFLHFQPENNYKALGGWVKYFKKQAEIFGLMLSKDIAFSSKQHVYRRFSKLSFEENKVIIDLTEVLNKPTDALENEFYISFKNNVTPIECSGGSFELYEIHNNFKTYKIKHTTDTVQITVK